MHNKLSHQFHQHPKPTLHHHSYQYKLVLKVHHYSYALQDYMNKKLQLPDLQALF